MCDKKLKANLFWKETNGLFGSLKNEEEYSRGESKSITLFGSFLRNEGEKFGGISTTSNPSFLISPNWRDFEGE